MHVVAQSIIGFMKVLLASAPTMLGSTIELYNTQREISPYMICNKTSARYSYTLKDSLLQSFRAQMPSINIYIPKFPNVDILQHQLQLTLPSTT